MENVPDILNHGGQNVAEEICQALEKRGYVCGYTLLNAAFYGVPQMRERVFLIAYRKEVTQKVTFPQPLNGLVLPPGYGGSRGFALRLLNGLFAIAHDYINPPVARPNLPPAVTAEEALGDLPPIYARELLARGKLRRGARRLDKVIRYDRRRRISEIGRAHV